MSSRNKQFQLDKKSKNLIYTMKGGSNIYLLYGATHIKKRCMCNFRMVPTAQSKSAFVLEGVFSAPCLLSIFFWCVCKKYHCLVHHIFWFLIHMIFFIIVHLEVREMIYYAIKLVQLIIWIFWEEMSTHMYTIELVLLLIWIFWELRNLISIKSHTYT
jgi:hypothetical protein